ncbi:MAG: septum formation protein Maf [Bacteroidia bacterium]|nr:septum formation protein Maf [Bacteroidia bacterium]
MKNLEKYNIILASRSPRRQQLLKGLDIPFTVKTLEIEEKFPEHLSKYEIPVYLAELKTKAFEKNMLENDLVITADTIVWLDGETLGKPQDYNDAVRILKKLSGEKHEVITGVCIKTKAKSVKFHALTDVYFKKLSDEEIGYYLDHYKPYDKAGAYGVQEWIGYIAVECVEGSYFNVMGLPIQRLYEHLKEF